ncbi:MAG: hypothetical protein ABEJ36_00105 [Candidatus Nanosalina sp.]
MLESQELFRDVVESTHFWTPSKDHDSKEGFRDDLHGFLKERVNLEEQGLKRNQRGIAVDKDLENVDISVDDSLGIVIEKDFSDNQTEELKEAVKTASEKYDFLIVLGCGVESVESWKNLKISYQGTREISCEIEFIWKDRSYFGEARDRLED